jgi:hypothetical protein
MKFTEWTYTCIYIYINMFLLCKKNEINYMILCIPLFLKIIIWTIDLKPIKDSKDFYKTSNNIY